jgi:hypothetical protein
MPIIPHASPGSEELLPRTPTIPASASKLHGAHPFSSVRFGSGYRTVYLALLDHEFGGGRTCPI